MSRSACSVAATAGIVARLAAAGSSLAAKPAIVEDAAVASYAELDRASANLALRLRERGVGTGDIVAVCGQRGIDFVIAVLAIWRCGAAYLPIASDTPPARVEAIVQQARCAAVLDATGNTPELATTLRWTRDTSPIDPQPWVLPAPDALAYVIYTSGTSGEPKGVMIEHAAMDATLAAFCAHFGIHEDDQVSAVATIAFDASVIEFWPALSRGATVHVAAQDTLLSPSRLIDWMAARRLSFCWLPTPIAETLIRQEHLQPPACLRVIETAGQRLTVRPRHWTVALENSYGPTETTVIATSGRVRVDGDTLPDIGNALPGVALHLLDADRRAVAPGETGQLYIGGPGLARGYLHRPDLTAAAFIDHPFAPGQRLYASGDLCRWNAEGRLEYLGRCDEQVKINGVRIEPAEIDQTLARMPAVECSVTVLEAVDEAALVCYYQLRDEISAAAVRDFLAAQLPAYLLPQRLHRVERMPLTRNGKIDRQALAQCVMPDADEPAIVSDELDDAQREFLQCYCSAGGVAAGWTQSFFEAGGNSIRAMLLLEALRRRYGLEIGFGAFFGASSAAAAYARLGAADAVDAAPRIAARPAAAGESAPLSVAQQSIWFLASLDPHDRAYHAKARLDFRGTVCSEALRAALQDVVDRHEIYRTTFHDDGGLVTQCIHGASAVTLAEYDLRALPSDAADTRVEELLQRDLNQPFALDRLPLARWGLARLPHDRHALLHIEHHLVHDGWSHNLFVGDLLTAYAARLDGRAPAFGAPALQYADFAVAQQRWLATPAAQAQESRWLERLTGAPPRIALPVNGTPQARGGCTLRLPLARTRWQRIERACAALGCTPFAFVLGALSHALNLHCQDDDLCIGSAFANRAWPGAGEIIGMMINTVVLRAQPRSGLTALELLRQCQATCSAAQADQEFPFERLVHALDPPRRSGENPLFQVFLGFHDSPLPPLSLPRVDECRLVEALDSRAAKFDLSLVVIPREDQAGEGDPVHLLWEFRESRFSLAYVQAIAALFERTLDAFLDTPGATLQDIGIAVTAPDIGDAVNATDAPESGLAVWTRVAAQAAATPERIALVAGSTTLTYAQLAAAVGASAAVVRAHGLMPGDLVGVMLPRDATLVIWLLAVQAAGCAFVPMDADYPSARLAHMARHSGLRAIVVAPDAQPDFCAGVMLIRSDAVAPPAAPDVGDPARPAYVIYTSGSTGTPKGVVVTQRNLANFLDSMRRHFPLDAPHRWLAVTSASFDISILELFHPLACGATLLLADAADVRDADRLAALAQNAGATHLQATPSTWKALLDTRWQPPAGFVALCGGEALDGALARALRERGVDLYNLYGPTETTIWSSLHRVGDDNGHTVALGRPLCNTQVYVLDRQLRRVPQGAIGELWIGGAGVAQGYLNDATLTAQRFRDDPWRAGNRIYATGDRVALNARGELDYHGRNDFQVKIRGFRIEAGEVEQVIRALDGISDVVVVARDDGRGAELVAYVVGEGAELGARARLRCVDHLPAHAVPLVFVQMTALPLTLNGKIDRNALPAPQRGSLGRMPEGATETALARILAERLQRDSVEATANFYALGGHSLLAMRIVAAINREFGSELAVADFLRLATVEQVARLIEQQAAAVADELTI